VFIASSISDKVDKPVDIIIGSFIFAISCSNGIFVRSDDAILKHGISNFFNSNALSISNGEEKNVIPIL